MRNVLRKWDGKSPEEIRRMQGDRLHRVITKEVAPFSNFYRAMFERENIDPSSIRTVEDLQRLPFTSKLDLLNTPEQPNRAKDFLILADQAVLSRRPELMLRALTRGKKAVAEQMEYRYRPVFMTSTTGRSSEPVPFFYTRHDIDNLSYAGAALCDVLGTDAEMKVLNMFPYAPHLAFWQVHYATMEYNIFNLSTGGGKVMGTAGNIRMLEMIEPDVIIGMPTFVYHLLTEALRDGKRFESIKLIVLGGEKVAKGMRRRLTALAEELGSANVSVMATYGFTEARMAFGECAGEGFERSGYHTVPDLAYFEIVDPKTGEVQGENEPGEIVVTPLNGTGSMVLRYRTGDMISGGLTYEPCPYCGLNVPRLVGNISRVSEVRELNIDKLKGTLVDFNDLEHLLDDEERLGTWQIELRKKNDDPLEVDVMILHVHTVADVDEERFVHEIEEKFKARTELRPNDVIFHSLEEMNELQGVGRELKEERLVDHRPKVES